MTSDPGVAARSRAGRRMESKESKAAGLISPGAEWRRLVQSTSLHSKIFECNEVLCTNRRHSAPGEISPAAFDSFDSIRRPARERAATPGSLVILLVRVRHENCCVG